MDKINALWVLAAIIALLIPVTAWLYLTDDRLIDGIRVWAKPLKFSISLCLYAATLAFVSKWIPAGSLRSHGMDAFVWVVIAAIIIEIVWLYYAAASGVRSHFNFDGGVLTAVYPLMGIIAVVLTSASLVFGVAIWGNTNSGLRPAVQDAISVGFILTFALTVLIAGAMALSGGALGGSINGPTSLIADLRNAGSDLRVAHFLATHSMHVLPLVGLLFAFSLPVGVARIATWTAMSAYTGFVLYLFWSVLSYRSDYG